MKRQEKGKEAEDNILALNKSETVQETTDQETIKT